MKPSNQTQAVPIPKWLCQSETGMLFSTCLVCHTDISENLYLVEKIIKNYPTYNTHEVLFEYAICIPCATKMHSDMSEKSKIKIESYFSSHIPIKEQSDVMQTPKLDVLNNRVAHCIVKHYPIHKASEYSLCALCHRNTTLIHDHMPYVIGNEAMDEITRLLSAQTLNIMNDFSASHFSGPPEVMDILKKTPILI